MVLYSVCMHTEWGELRLYQIKCGRSAAHHQIAKDHVLSSINFSGTVRFFSKGSSLSIVAPALRKDNRSMKQVR